MNDTQYIGLDVHQATISAVVLDPAPIRDGLDPTARQILWAHLQFLFGLPCISWQEMAPEEGGD